MAPILSLLEEHASRAHASASALARWSTGNATDDALDEISRAEEAAEEALDEIEARLIDSLTEKMDRDDLHSIATSLVALHRSSTRTARAVRFDDARHDDFAALTSLGERATASLAIAVGALAASPSDTPRALDQARAVQKMKREARELHHVAVASLAAEERGPIAFLVTKDALDSLHRTIERASVVASRLAHVAMKNA